MNNFSLIRLTVLIPLLFLSILRCTSSTTPYLSAEPAYSDTLSEALRLREVRDLAGASHELERIIALQASPSLKSQATWELYLVHRDAGEALSALKTLLSCLQQNEKSPKIEGRARSSLGPAVVEALHAGESWSTVSDLLGNVEDTPLLLDVSSYLMEEGDCHLASRLLGRLARTGLDHVDEQRRSTLARKTTKCLEKNHRSLALVIPLSGEYSEYGNSLAMGAELALGDLPMVLDIERIDTKSDPVTAVIATEQLAASPHVIAALGPLQSRAATGAALAAEKGELPILIPLLAPRSLDRLGEWVFQSSAPLQSQARTVAKYAMVQGGLSRFAVLYPAHAAGERATEAFRNQVYDLGGEVITLERYIEGLDTTFRNQIVNIKRASPQALFVPGEPRELVQIARQVAFYELECQLLGTSGWNSPEVIRLGKRHVEGVIFADLGDVVKNTSAGELFRARFHDKFDRDPDHYASLGYDLAGCVVKAFDEGRTTRTGVRRFLRGMGPTDGVSGVLSWRDDDSTGSVRLYTIANGLVVPLSATP